MSDGACGEDDAARRLPAWARWALLFAVVVGVVSQGAWLILEASSRAAHLLLPALFLPITSYLAQDSIRRMPRPEQAVDRAWMVPWSGGCVGVVCVALILLLDNCQGFAALLYGALVATPSFFIVSFFAVQYRSSGYFPVVVYIGLALFLLEWLLIWSIGSFFLWQRRPIPLIGIAAAHFGLGFAVLAVPGVFLL